MVDMNSLTNDQNELQEVARTFEPPAWVLPAWVIEAFEAQGGVFAGKRQLDDGTGRYTITGIERFSDEYVREVALGVRSGG